MAELQAVSLTKQALQQLEDHLTCSICFNSLKKPKMLSCAHVFCQDCIQCLVKPARRGRSLVTCPFCSKETALPSGGVTSLQEAFYVNSLAEIQGTLEKVSEADEEPVPSAPCLEDLISSVPQRLCSIHQKELDFYCETCSVLICSHCTMKEHQNHQFILSEDHLSAYGEELRSHLEPVNKELAQLLNKVDDDYRMVVTQRSSLELQVNTMIERDFQEIKLKKARIINKLYSTTHEKLQSLLTAKKDVLDMQNEMKDLKVNENCVENVKAKLSTCSKELDELKLDFFVDLAEVAGQHDDVNFKIYAMGMELTTAQVGKRAATMIHQLDDSDPPLLESQVIYDFTFSDATCDAVPCDVTLISNRSHEVSFVPKWKGKHALHIKANGQHIFGSPFPLLVTLPVEQMDSPLHVIDGVIGPFGIAVDMHGRLVVAEYGLHRVSIYSHGKRISSFGGRGSGDGKFVNPRGIAIDDNGSIYVSDEGNNRIQKFTSEGIFMSSAGCKGTGLLEFSAPAGISYNPNNQKLYVADMKNSRIQVLFTDLTFSHFFGSKGSELGQLAYPWDIAFDRSGNVFVADTSNHRIQVFTPKGHFLYSINGSSQGKGDFETPSGVAVDDNSVLYITDLKRNKILAYSTDGDFKAAFGQLGNQPGQFNLPHGLAIDNESGVIYISDLKNKRVQCY